MGNKIPKLNNKYITGQCAVRAKQDPHTNISQLSSKSLLVFSQTLVCVFETGTCYTAETGFRVIILLPQVSGYWRLQVCATIVSSARLKKNASFYSFPVSKMNDSYFLIVY